MNRYLGFKEKKILINSFIYGSFDCCPLDWHFYPKNPRNKLENIQKSALRFLLNDYEIDYITLLKKSNKCKVEVRRLRTLALESFKILNDLNPAFMKNLFAKREESKRRKTTT